MSVSAKLNYSLTDDTISITMDRLSAQFLLRELKGEFNPPYPSPPNPPPLAKIVQVLEAALTTEFE